MGNEKNRGEIGEIRTQLNALSSSGSRPEAAAAKKELFKKVINCMTIGIDMSSLFMQVMTAGMSNAEDVVLKKMLYLFICTYAQSNPDLTLLTINLLNKDCKDQDPTIRGLALRSLCSLRVANLIEYIVSKATCNLRLPLEGTCDQSRAALRCHLCPWPYKTETHMYAVQQSLAC